MIAGIGVVVSTQHLHAVAVDRTGTALGEQRVGGVATVDAMSAALGRVVGSLGGCEVPVAVAWDDGVDRRPARLDGVSPSAVATQLRRWAAAGIGEISVGSDIGGGRWAAPISTTLADAVDLAARQAGLTLIGTEPAGGARARHPGRPVVDTMALVAAGQLPPATRSAIAVTAAAGRDDAGMCSTVWVIERVVDPPDPAPGVHTYAMGGDRRASQAALISLPSGRYMCQMPWRIPADPEATGFPSIVSTAQPSGVDQVRQPGVPIPFVQVVDLGSSIAAARIQTSPAPVEHLLDGHGVASGGGEESAGSPDIDHPSVSPDHDPTDAADHAGRQDVERVELDPAGRGAPPTGRLDRVPVRSPALDHRAELLLEHLLGDDDVDDRGEADHIRAGGGGALKDRDQRVGPSLGLGALEQADVGVVTKTFDELGPLGIELGLGEPIEDLGAARTPAPSRPPP